MEDFCKSTNLATTTPWIAQFYAPVDFSKKQGFPHEHPYVGCEAIPKFHGYDDSIMYHLSSFLEFNKSNGLFHEDVIMKFFALSLKGYANDWFMSLVNVRI
jgi:hypothetical protein